MPRESIDAAGFVQLVASAYPDLRAELDEDNGLEHVQMHTFCDHTQAAIDCGDMASVVTCFGIADRVIADGDDSMQNAIHVSFLEHLDFRGTHGRQAFGNLTQRLRTGWQDINEYMDALLKGDWTWKEPPKKERGSTKKERGSKRRRRRSTAVNRTTSRVETSQPDAIVAEDGRLLPKEEKWDGVQIGPAWTRTRDLPIMSRLL